jgi:glutathione S-transferase
MLTLFHHPLCPHSRFVRLALAEYKREVRLIEERTWERRQDFLAMNPAGTTPVLLDKGLLPVPRCDRGRIPRRDPGRKTG